MVLCHTNLLQDIQADNITPTAKRSSGKRLFNVSIIEEKVSASCDGTIPSSSGIE